MSPDQNVKQNKKQIPNKQFRTSSIWAAITYKYNILTARTLFSISTLLIKCHLRDVINWT